MVAFRNGEKAEYPSLGPIFKEKASPQRQCSAYKLFRSIKESIEPPAQDALPHARVRFIVSRDRINNGEGYVDFLEPARL